MMDKVLVDNIIEIGKENKSFDIRDFLPDFPTPRGSEPIFKISWANANRFPKDEAEHFIKGLHIIEMRYKEETNNDFGLGSPYPTFKVIRALSKLKPELAEELKSWVANNGGNYYI